MGGREGEESRAEGEAVVGSPVGRGNTGFLMLMLTDPCSAPLPPLPPYEPPQPLTSGTPSPFLGTSSTCADVGLVVRVMMTSRRMVGVGALVLLAAATDGAGLLRALGEKDTDG